MCGSADRFGSARSRAGRCLKPETAARRRLERSEHESRTPKIPLLWDESALTRTSMPLLPTSTRGAEELAQCGLSVVVTEATDDVARQRAHLRLRVASVSRKRELTHR
jgi:hypothetical protein